MPEVIPNELVEEDKDWFPKEPEVIPNELVEYEKDWLPMLPEVIPNELVEDEKDWPPIDPLVIPSELVDQLSAKEEFANIRIKEIAVIKNFLRFILLIYQRINFFIGGIFLKNTL